jgi:hypothetical protein
MTTLLGFVGWRKKSLFQTAAVECRTCSGSLSQSQRLYKWTKWVWWWIAAAMNWAKEEEKKTSVRDERQSTNGPT